MESALLSAITSLSGSHIEIAWAVVIIAGLRTVIDFIGLFIKSNEGKRRTRP